MKDMEFMIDEYWKQKSLEQMSDEEWENLCDGCGKCCLNKVEDYDTGELFFTDVACKLLDLKKCRCQSYKNRKRFVPDCQILTPKKVRRLPWLPSTCSYRLLAEGKDLPSWHHLKTGSRQSIHNAGQSVRGRCVDERHVKDLEDHIIDWIE